MLDKQQDIKPEFNIGFKMSNYKKMGILPSLKEYLLHDKIINYDLHLKDNYWNCVWKKQPEPKIVTTDYMEQEARRILRTGVWACIKHEIVWIPPPYYEFLQYFTTVGEAPEFRLKRLKHVYEKLRVRNNPLAIGTYTIKNRQDGETTSAMSDTLWEVADGNMDYGSIGMQSKTNKTVTQSCWRTLTMGWRTYPQWLKDTLYSDFISGDKIAEKMKFIRERSEGDDGRDVEIAFFPSVANAMDSMNNMRRCILDEVNKWIECSFYDAFINYKKFIAPAGTRKGLFDIFSSPADFEGFSNEEALDFWKRSNPDELINGTTATGIFRIYSNPLDGVEGRYDRFGDANPSEIEAWIMNERKNIKPEKLMAEIRGYPLNEEEMFGSFEGSPIFENHKQMMSRKIHIFNRRFKDDETKEPRVLYGNYQWIGGVPDTDVEFVIAKQQKFDRKEARVCHSYLPDEKTKPALLYDRFGKPIPPRYVENLVGVDPANNRYTNNKKSNGKPKVDQSNYAMVNRMFRDIHNRFKDVVKSGIIRIPTMIYLARPVPLEIAYEDTIKAAVYNRGLIQYENKNDKLANYCEDRGYFDWLLPSIGEDRDSTRKGDAPSGNGKKKSAFLDECIALTDAVTREDDLALEWFIELLEDRIKFNPLDTHEYDLTMADFQALLGVAKLMYKKIRKKSSIGTRLLDQMV